MKMIYHSGISVRKFGSSKVRKFRGSLINCLIALLLLPGIAVKAQNQIKKEVEVVKPYEPVVSDANKINVLPKMNDSVTIRPKVQYNIVPSAMNVEYQVNPINAAKMLSMPIPKLYKSYLKLGFGNYATPKAEVYINSLRSKTHTAGLFFRHQSSGGKVKLENNKKVHAGYSETSGELFGKKFFKSAYLYGDGGLSSNTIYHYGYDPKLDTTLEKGDIRQNYFLARLRAVLQSMHTDSSKLSYHIGLDYNFFEDRFKHKENNVNLTGQFHQQIKTGFFGLNTSLNMLNRNETLDSARNVNSLFLINPWMGLSSPDYRLQIGLNMAFENEDNSLHIRFYPKAEFQFVAVKDVIIPFLGITGQPVQHSYRDIAGENPFIRPDLLVKNSNLKLNFYGGLKGSLAAKASYVARFDYSSFSNYYLFVNDTSSVLRNQFTAVYTDADVYNGYLEINYDYSDTWTFGAKANVYSYNLTREQYAWHRPSFDLTLSLRYNLRNKILANFDVVALGKRKAKESDAVSAYKELASVLDFNLGLEYRYTKILSIWLRFNNFTASKYEMWNQYPTQRFNMMAGITYSL
jgi:hypothetical protein